MKISTFAIRVWRLASIVGFGAILINTYTKFEGRVAVGFTAEGRPDVFLSREALFYGCVAIFLINNTLVNLVGTLFPRLPGSVLPVPNAAVWAAHRTQLNEIVRNWFLCLTAAVNTVMLIALLVLTRLNQQLGVDRLSGYEWLLPVSTGIILIVIVSLPIRLYMKPDSEE